MQRGQRGVVPDRPLGRLIVETSRWGVYEMVFTPDRIAWLGEQLQRYPSLTTDPTKQDPDNLYRSVTSRQAYWTEVWDNETNRPAGVLYMTDIQPGVEATVHPVFFDRKLSEKAEICIAALQWAKRQFMLHRFKAELPEIYFATVRLAKRIGFTLEGTRREVYLIEGRWVDELVFGLLTSEMK